MKCSGVLTTLLHKCNYNGKEGGKLRLLNDLLRNCFNTHSQLTIVQYRCNKIGILFTVLYMHSTKVAVKLKVLA